MCSTWPQFLDWASGFLSESSVGFLLENCPKGTINMLQSKVLHKRCICTSWWCHQVLSSLHFEVNFTATQQPINWKYQPAGGAKGGSWASVAQGLHGSDNKMNDKSANSSEGYISVWRKVARRCCHDYSFSPHQCLNQKWCAVRLHNI